MERPRPTKRSRSRKSRRKQQEDSSSTQWQHEDLSSTLPLHLSRPQIQLQPTVTPPQESVVNHSIVERDQNGDVVATYTHLESSNETTYLPSEAKSYSWQLLYAFLPAGYPASVTPDYLPYQIYAFSSSIAGLLASRAVLEGIGVGNVNANATAAVLLSILQTSVGRIATILFASKLGTSLEPECKMYRLLADILNDAAMLLDCVSPALPKLPRVVILSLASVLRALCGVAAGSSKASLSAHFATQGNLGELNAKDSSQETIISLLGMLAGSLVVSRITTPWSTWTAMLFLLSVHLYTNYLAVRSVTMTTLNRQRANIVFSEVLRTSVMSTTITKDTIVHSPYTTSIIEKIFETDGCIWTEGRIKGYCRIGVSFKQVARILESFETTTLKDVLDIFAKEQYILWFDATQRTVMIVFKEKASVRDQLRAFLHAVLLLDEYGSRNVPLAALVKQTMGRSRTIWESLLPQLVAKGWNLEVGALETSSSYRILEQDIARKTL